MRTPIAKLLIAAAGLAAAGMVVSAEHAPADSSFLPAPIFVALQNTGAVERLAAQGQGETFAGTPNAHYVAVSDDGGSVLVSDIGNGRAYVLDGRSGEIRASVPVGAVAQGVKISPDGRVGLAIGAGPGTLTAIDMATGEVTKQIAVGANPHNIRFTADGARAYVSLQGAGAIAIVDPKRLEKVREIPVEGMATPHNLDLSDDGTRLWLRDFEGSAAVLDLESGEVLARFDAGPAHGGIDVIPGGRYAATVAIGGSEVLLIDQETLQPVTSIEVGEAPHGVRASADGRWLYVALTAGNRVAVIDMQSLEVVHEMATDGAFPFWLAVPGNR